MTTRTSLRIEFLLPHPAYNPDLALSDLHPFGPLKEALRGRRFADDDELKHSVPEELWCFGKEFSGTGIQRLAQRWKKCVDNEENVKIISAL